MMLYALLADDAKEDAFELLNERWSRIVTTKDRWPERIQAGDAMAWREKLIGYYIGDVPAGEIFDHLEDEQAYAQSDFRYLPLPRQGMLCEAYLYDAMLAKVKGDNQRYRSSLQQVLETDHRSYYEYKMAQGINEIQETNNLRVSSDLPLICILLSVFGFGIVSLAIQQSEINKFYNETADF